MTPTSKIDNDNNNKSVLLVQQDDLGVLTLTLNRPQQRNALNRQLLLELHTVLSKIDASVRVIVVQGSGPVFCSGHDLKELSKLDPSQQEDVFQTCNQVMRSFQEVPQPTISLVNGMATAAGCQLVAATDMAVASFKATFCTPGVNLGLFCHTPAVPLVRCVGTKRAMDMLLTGRIISAQEALEYGLVSRLVADIETEGPKLAEAIASKSACAVQMGKRIFYQQA